MLGKVLGRNELILSEANLGYAGGNNLGIAHALRGTAPFVLLLNGDAAIAEQNLASLLATMRDNSDVAILGPTLHEWQHGGAYRYAGGKDIAQHALTRLVAPPRVPGDSLRDVDYVPGAVFLARRSLFETIGMLDEQFFFSGEIADLCKRARSSGYRVCVDLAVEAQHDARETPQPLRDTLYTYYSLRNRLLYANKHYPSEKAKHRSRWLKFCLAELGRALAAGRLGKARAIALAIAHGCAGRFGNQNASFL
jgi:GT2 family glycosyltransferase